MCRDCILKMLPRSWQNFANTMHFVFLKRLRASVRKIAARFRNFTVTLPQPYQSFANILHFVSKHLRTTLRVAIDKIFIAAMRRTITAISQDRIARSESFHQSAIVRRRQGSKKLHRATSRETTVPDTSVRDIFGQV